MRAISYLLIFFLVTACQAQNTSNQETYPETYYSSGPRSYDGIGKYYMGREISDVMGHLGAPWLDRESRQKQERTDLVLANLELAQDAVVADIGAGSGYYSFRIARLVPEGQVLAVDIQPEMLTMIQTKKEELGIENVTPILGEITDPQISEYALDLVFMVDVYHEFSHPREMMQALFKVMKPGGRVILLEYRKEEPSIPIKPRHKMNEAQAQREMAVVGLEFVENKAILPWQHFLVFRKPK